LMMPKRYDGGTAFLTISVRRKPWTQPKTSISTKIKDSSSHRTAKGGRNSTSGWRHGKGVYLLLLCPYLFRLVRHVQRFMHERISSTPRTSIKSFHGVKRSLNKGRLKTTDWAKRK
jgi:hypothetical protein